VKKNRELYDAYCDGDNLQDADVIEGEKHFRRLSALLFESGPAFVIMAKESYRVYLGYRGFREARKLPEPAMEPKPK
jgi:hypothetical protein